MFSSATNNLFKRFNVELFKVVKDSLQLTTLSLPCAAAFQGRLKCLRPEAVNAALFDMANQKALGHLPENWNFNYTLSPDVRPVWTGSTVRAAEATGADGPQPRQEQRRRLRGKQAAGTTEASSGAAAPGAGGVPPVVARERPRVRPLHKTAVAATTFTEEEQQILDALPRYQKAREQKRLMHNKAAAADPTKHFFDGFADADTTKLRCQRCTNMIDLRIKPGSPYLDWSAARRDCPGGSTEGIDTDRRNVAKLTRERNNKIREHNMRWWGADEKKHIFFEVGPTTFDTCQCRRPQCWLSEHRPWTYFKRYGKATQACQGGRIQDEMTSAYSPALAVVDPSVEQQS